MGEPVGDEYTAGDDCGICWGLGKPFGDVPIPEKVFVTWTGLIAPFIDGNKTFIATQNWLTPCMWEYDDGEFIGNWFYDAVRAAGVIQLKVDPATFHRVLGGVCALTCTDGVATCKIS